MSSDLRIRRESRKKSVGGKEVKLEATKRLTPNQDITYHLLIISTTNRVIYFRDDP